MIYNWAKKCPIQDFFFLGERGVAHIYVVITVYTVRVDSSARYSTFIPLLSSSGIEPGIDVHAATSYFQYVIPINQIPYLLLLTKPTLKPDAFIALYDLVSS